MCDCVCADTVISLRTTNVTNVYDENVYSNYDILTSDSLSSMHVCIAVKYMDAKCQIVYSSNVLPPSAAVIPDRVDAFIFSQQFEQMTGTVCLLDVCHYCLCLSCTVLHWLIHVLLFIICNMLTMHR